MIEIEYTRKPSIVSIRSAIRKAAKAGKTFIQINWGENQITVERCRFGWEGSGWIGRHGGYDLAREMNKPGVAA
jgi:hypothetical protein